MKSKLLFLLTVTIAFYIPSFGQPANDVISGAIPITPSAEGTGCETPNFYLPFTTDGTTASGAQGP